jgi:hypothetical protein
LLPYMPLRDPGHVTNGREAICVLFS